MNFKLLAGAASAAIVVAASPVFAGHAGTHVHTIVHRHPVEDRTVVREVTRVHPVITDIERVLHHTQIERSTQEVGPAPAQGTQHVVTHYHDVYRPETRVHTTEGAPAIDHEITRIENVNVHHHRTVHEHATETAAAIVHHRREDVDP